ncbi:SoxR reducing system RseC family protein [Pseudomonas nitroreducens]|uniref:SoxR reducing system RseC family protein n=1 Tax=Pseudomonas nitroreducens TaxID=46680 RepID=UPI0021AA9E47|nr:SoxR reducing system RseC family protein [Pseudomonas nitritireducens]
MPVAARDYWRSRGSSRDVARCASLLRCERFHRKRLRCSLRPATRACRVSRPNLLLKSPPLFFLLPLLGSFALAWLAARSGFGESLIIAVGGAGFLLARLLVRRLTRRQTDDPAMQPVVLRTLVGGPPGPV